VNPGMPGFPGEGVRVTYGVRYSVTPSVWVAMWMTTVATTKATRSTMAYHATAQEKQGQAARHLCPQDKESRSDGVVVHRCATKMTTENGSSISKPQEDPHCLPVLEQLNAGVATTSSRYGL